MKAEFREAIQELAEKAREDDRRARQAAVKRRRPIAYVIAGGAMLIAVQVALYFYLHSKKEEMVPAHAAPTTARELPVNTCAGMVHRTYWQVVAYLRDHGHPPEALNDLVGKYADKVPVDPRTGQPLAYSTDGERFELRCPGAPAKR